MGIGYSVKNIHLVNFDQIYSVTVIFFDEDSNAHIEVRVPKGISTVQEIKRRAVESALEFLRQCVNEDLLEYSPGGEAEKGLSSPREKKGPL